MKYTSIFILVSIFHQNESHAQGEILNNYFLDSLYGKVKSVKKTYYEYNINDLTNPPTITSQFIINNYFLNKEGKLIIKKGEIPIINHKEIKSFNYLNNKSKQINTITTNNDSISITYKNENIFEVQLYDEKHNLLKFEQFMFSKEGLLLKSFLGWKNHEIMDSTIYNYSINSLTLILNYSKSILKEKSIINYHENGQKSTVINYNYYINRYDTICKTKIDSFSIDGKLISQKNLVKHISWKEKQKNYSYNSGEIGIEALREFPHDYEKSEHIDPFVQTIYYKYDLEGLLISIEHNDENFIVYRKDYFKYDTFKNCIEEGVLLNDVEYPIYKNQIEYY
jgi:hypothetical protein